MDLSSSLLDSDNQDNCLSYEMPLFGWGSKKSKDVEMTSTGKVINYKSRTEHKLLLAKQDPEPVFDLTDCNLHDVSTGVYSWCKVCRKEVLLLQNNLLKSLNGGGNFGDLTLLRVLDVHNNRISKLPDCLGELINLQALYVHFNELKHLPESLRQINGLQVLNIKGNRFKEVPSVICDLQSLRKLDISANIIRRLPDSLINLKLLTDMVLDQENFEYPPRDICIDGLDRIMKFLNKGSMDYTIDSTSDCTFDLQPKLHYDTGENSHQTAHLEAEASLQMLYNNLAHVAMESRLAKSRFMEELIQDKDRFTEELNVAQSKKDDDRQRLLIDLYEVEKESMEAVKQLLQINELTRNHETILEVIERERRDFEDLFKTVQNEAIILRRKEVLEAMESILENQFLEAEMNSAIAQDKRQHTERTKLENMDFERRLCEIKCRSDKNQENLMTEIAREEEIQKVAFGALMMRRDDDYLHITQQISLIEQELTNLTLLEVSKSQLRVEFEKSMMCEQRDVLTKLLIQLMEQQDRRRREFEKRLEEIEERRTVEESDFWLKQYQRLMDVKPEQISVLAKPMEEQVKMILRKAGAEDHILRFARHGIQTVNKLSQLGHDQLKSIGINDVFMREDIIRETRLYIDNRVAEQPSAPPARQEERQSSLRTRFETECVICLDQKCNMLFLNCGHVCCCEVCGRPPLSSCPLCRSQIERAIQLRFG